MGNKRYTIFCGIIFLISLLIGGCGSTFYSKKSWRFKDSKDGNKKLDSKDELLFMVRDAGLQKPEEDWPDGVSRGIEIKIIDPLSSKEGFVYLFNFYIIIN